jgi:hypothetical protein
MREASAGKLVLKTDEISPRRLRRALELGCAGAPQTAFSPLQIVVRGWLS